MELGEPIDLAVGVRLLSEERLLRKAGAPFWRYDIRTAKLESALPYFEKAFSVADTELISQNGEEGKREFCSWQG